MATLRCCVRIASNSIGTSTSTSTNAATSSSPFEQPRRHQPRLLPHTCRATTGRGAVSLSRTRTNEERHLPVSLRSFEYSSYPLGALSDMTVQCGKRHSRTHICAASAADSSSSSSPDPSSSSSSYSPADFSTIPPVQILKDEGPKSFWQNWQSKSAALRERVSKWGLAAVLAYGIFDGLTYTTFFVLAFLSYEKSTGQNPAANIKALLGVVVLMWGANNVTRPFRVAGAAALAPFIDRGLKKMQEVLKLPNQAFAFMICVAVLAGVCLSVMGLLILSRLVI